MSLPSDTTADISPGRASRRADHATRLSREQRGLIVAALTAFFGIAYGGSALTRLLRKPTPRERLARRIEETRREAGSARTRGKTGAMAGK